MLEHQRLREEHRLETSLTAYCTVPAVADFLRDRSKNSSFYSVWGLTRKKIPVTVVSTVTGNSIYPLISFSLDEKKPRRSGVC